MPYNGKDDFINSLADHEQMVRRNEKRIPEIEKEAEKDFRELLNNYNTANDPVASYHKYLSNEYLIILSFFIVPFLGSDLILPKLLI